MAETIEILNVAARPGEKSKGWHKIAETPLSDVAIPIGIVNGAKPGPILCITGGVHGSEYPGITAVGETFRDLDPTQMSGAVVTVPVVNTLAYERRVGFVVPVDNLNPNRVAPGDADGSMAEVLIHTLLNDVIGRCEYHIDCHGGDLGEVLNPHAIFTRTGNARVDEYSDAMARVYDTPFLVPTGEGSLLPFPKGTVHEEVARRGIPSIVGEVGSDGSLEREEADRHYRGIQNVLRFLGILPGAPQITVKQYFARTKFFIHARRGGLLHLRVKLDDMVESGQPVAEVHDLWGETREVISSPENGIVRFILTRRVVNTGDAIMNCWGLETPPPNNLTDRFVRATQ